MSGIRILVVDDEPAVGQSIRFTLQLDGHAVEIVSSAAEALEKYKPGEYAVVVTDNKMGGMTGPQLAARIRSLSPTQPIILLSGSPPFSAASLFDRMVLKPFSTVDLRKTVRELAEGRPSAPASPVASPAKPQC